MIITDLISLFKGLVLITNVLPVLTGFCLALYFTNASFGEHWKLFLITIIGSTLVVAGALTLNNWYEVDLDREMVRTQKRPTVTGNFSMKTVLLIGIILSAVGFFILLFTTLETFVYALIGWITYVVLYTFWSKRKYTLNTAIGSVSGAVTPLIGWAAIAPSYHIVPIVLALLIFIWQIPHTFAIGIRRCDEYKAAGVAMLPVVRGFANYQKTNRSLCCLSTSTTFLYTSIRSDFYNNYNGIKLVVFRFKHCWILHEKRCEMGTRNLPLFCKLFNNNSLYDDFYCSSGFQ